MEEFKNITSNIEDNILYETLMKRKGGFNLRHFNSRSNIRKNTT